MDAVTLHFDTCAQPGSTPDASTYRITVQVNWPRHEADFRSAERGDGPNNDIDDRSH